jgi:hypothetical protein
MRIFFFFFDQSDTILEHKISKVCTLDELLLNRASFVCVTQFWN